MASPKEIKKLIEELNPDATFIRGFDNAIFGTAKTVGKNKVVAAYDSDECIKILIKQHQMSELEAFEHMESIISEGKYSKNKPLFMSDLRLITNLSSIVDLIKKDTDISIEDILDEEEDDERESRKFDENN